MHNNFGNTSDFLELEGINIFMLPFFQMKTKKHGFLKEASDFTNITQRPFSVSSCYSRNLNYEGQ
jgi:hypothetical protein